VGLGWGGSRKHDEVAKSSRSIKPKLPSLGAMLIAHPALDRHIASTCCMFAPPAHLYAADIAATVCQTHTQIAKAVAVQRQHPVS
jgi:hypothetical protein